MKSKSIVFAILFLIIMSLIPTAFALDFSDVPDDFWAYKEIEELTNTGIISGYPDGTYRLHGTIKRSEFLKLVLITCYPQEPSFLKEVKEGEHWAKYYFEYAKKYDLLDADWTIDNIDNLITRKEMSRLIAHAEMRVTQISTGSNKEREEVYELAYETEKPDFSDINDLKALDVALLSYNVKNKYLYGYEDGTFKPEKNMTRAETACVIYRLKGVVEKYVDYTPIKKSSPGSSTTTKYTITYDANGGENAPASEKKTKGKDYTISAQQPTKPENIFLGWNKNPNSNEVLYVGGDKYKENADLKLYAVWQENGHEETEYYLIQFVDYDGTILQSGEVAYGKTPIYNGATPTRTGDAEWSYIFDKWTPDLVPVTGNATYTATYEREGIEVERYVITFVDEDGTFIASGDYEYGTEADDIVLPADPTKSGDAEWSYTFDAWTPDIEDVTEDATYKATYTQTKNRYVVTFVDEDGTFIASGDYEYGTETGDIALPREPMKSGDAEWSYVFEKWNPDIVAVVADAIYTASYTRAPIKAQYVSGDRFNTMIKELATGTASTVDTADSTITSIKFQTAKPSDAILADAINVGVEGSTLLPIYAWFDSGTIKLWSEAQNITMSDDASYMFKDLNALLSLNPTEDLAVNSTTNVTNMSHMFEKCINMTILDVSGLDTSNVTDMYAMFKECQKVSSLATIATFDTKNVTNMGGMFYDCRALTSLDLSTFDTSSVEEIKAMFFNCAMLSSLILTDFNTSLVTDFNGLFANCSNLTTLDLSSFDTSNVTNMNLMFYSCTKLSNIVGLGDFNTESLQTTGSMFFNCDGLTTLDLSNWNTTSLTSCNGGAQSLPSGAIPQHYNGMFEGCDNLTQLDLRGWNTINLTNTSYMFAFCHNLQKIYASTSFVVTNVTNDENMFKSDTTVHPSPKLRGGNGTTYDASHIDKEYAWLDGIDGKPGYFWCHFTYTIAFDSNGGTGSMENIVADYGVMKRLTANTFTFEGKAFREWNTQTNGSGDSYADKARVRNLTFVSGDVVTLYAQWDDLKYSIQFVNEDGTVLQSGEVAYGVMPVYSGDTPTKSGDAEWSYTFDKWVPDIVPASGDAIYTASYIQTKNRYEIRFEDEDGTLLLSGDYEYGTDKDAIVKPADPTKSGDAQYSYTFDGWTPNISNVTRDAVYTAKYKQKINTYYIYFYNYNGHMLDVIGVYAYGEMPSYNKPLTREPTAQYTYTHTGWDPPFEPVTKSTSYTAVYTETLRKYNVEFVNEDGTVLQSGEVEYGTLPSYSGATPTKSGDAEWSYEFDEWTPEIVPASGDAIYTATYTKTKNRYVVTFEDEDGTFILSGDYEYGTQASAIVLPADPTKSGDAEYTYTFDGWEPDIVEVTQDATYTATYERHENNVTKYTIEFLDEDGTLLQSGLVAEGTLPVYEGGIPTKPADEYYRYVFENWYPEPVPATEDATYQAYYYSVYEEEYAIIYMPNANGDYVEDMPYSDTKYEGYEYYIAYDTPKREGYRFNYWEAYSGDEITIYYPGDEYTEDADLRLYAHWTFRGYGPPIITYYDNASGDPTVANMPEPQEKPIGEEIQLSDKIPTREGYYFKGWGTRSDDYYVSWNPGDYYGDDYDLDLYALWQDTTIKVGDYVKYNPTSATYTLTKEKTGYDYSPDNATIETDTGTRYWRVWKVSGDEIQIIPGRALNEEEIHFQGIIGVTIGAPSTLDEICSTLYSCDGISSSVRSQRIEDILEVAEITENGVEHFGFAYFLDGDNTPYSGWYTKTYAYEPLENGFEEPRFYIWYSDEDEEIKYDLAQQLKHDENGIPYMVPIAGHPVYVKHNATYGFEITRWKTIAYDETNATSTSRYEQIIEGHGGRFHGDAWLATVQTFLNYPYCNYGVTAFYYNTSGNNKKLSGGDIAFSNGKEVASSGLGVRPIVTLRSDIKVVGGTGYDEAHGWVLEPAD